MKSFSESFLKKIGCHFVSISCVQKLIGIGEENVFIFSGFLVEVRDVWFYVTAGHIIRDVKESLEKGAKFDVWRLGDQTAGNKYRAAIPYAFDINKWYIIEDKDLGFDYAVIQMDMIYCMQLKAGGAVPIQKAAWGDHRLKYDQWALVGIPSETVKYDQETILSCKIAIVPINPTEEPPVSGSQADNRFYARLKDLGNLGDIDGMSGGPIFGLRWVEDWCEYKVIGVQSGWYRGAKTITVSPFKYLGVKLETLVESAGLRKQSEKN